MKYLVFVAMMAFSALLYSQEFLVVTSLDTHLEQLTQFQLQRLYLGKLDRIDDQALVPVQLRKGDPVREVFEEKVFGPRADLEDYWLTQKLQVGAEPPFTVGSWALMLAYISRNPGFIGYLPKDKADHLKRYRLRILTIIDEYR